MFLIYVDDTVDGRIPAPVVVYPIISRVEKPSKVVQDFFHPPYVMCDYPFLGA